MSETSTAPSNPVNYFEIGTPDAVAARAFYSGVFGWHVAGAGAGGYAPVNGNEGGVWDTTSMGGRTWAIFYVQVDDVSDTLAAVTARGGHVVLPQMDNGTITFAHVADPAGNRFGVWQRSGAATSPA